MANKPPPVNCSRCGEPYSSYGHQCKTANDTAQGPLDAASGSGDWDVERTHGRLCKVQYDIGCTEADQYCDHLRKDGWKAWSVSSDGKRVTEVFYLRYTNTAHEHQLPSQNPDSTT